MGSLERGRRCAWVLLLAGATAAGATAAPPLDEPGGYASTHVIARLRPGIQPGALPGGGGAVPPGRGAAVAEPAATFQRWRVQSVKPLFEGGPANPVLAAQLGLDRLYRIATVPGTDTPAMAADLARLADLFDQVEPDAVGGVAAAPPDDPDFGIQWGLDNTGQTVGGIAGAAGADINILPGWDLTTGDPDLVLAVLDAGMDPHIEIVDRMIPGKNVAADPDNDDTSNVCGSHGTHVAGIAAADANNSEGIAGVDRACRIMPVRVLNGCMGDESVLAEGLIWATDNGADVINMSLQYYTGTATLRSAVLYAYGSGVVMIAAAGNNQGCPGTGTTVAFPGQWPQTIAVAGINNIGERAWFSNCGPEIDVAAPGDDIWSLLGTTQYEYRDGTSMAAPHVSGTVALMKALNPQLTPAQIRQILQDTAVDIEAPGFDNKTGYGLVDAHAALASVAPPCPWDLGGDGTVSTADFLDLLSQWGTDPGGPPDFDGNGAVSTADFLELLSHWGPCP